MFFSKKLIPDQTAFEYMTLFLQSKTKCLESTTFKRCDSENKSLNYIMEHFPKISLFGHLYDRLNLMFTVNWRSIIRKLAFMRIVP